MHHMSKCIYLQQIKLVDSCSASQNLSEKHSSSLRSPTDIEVCLRATILHSFQVRLVGLSGVFAPFGLVAPLSACFSVGVYSPGL